jgi:sphinganine-1-phosphate aldolase
MDRIIPETAHTAFHKAAEYFKIKLQLVSCKLPSYKAHASSFTRLINPNTVLLVASAPNYPHGIIDDIPSLSKLAAKRRIPLHVDCCLGSFLIPYLEKAGFPSEPFDFKLKGVTSISCDTHKYGFAPKGSSTLLYRTEELRSHQYFISPNWPGGVYASPSMAGSRPGSLIAGTWASMMAQGENGYIDACHKIIGAARSIESAIREDPDLNVDLRVIGRPLLSVVAFGSTTIDIYAVADGMSAKGWHLNALQNPPAVHVAVTLPMTASWERLIADLKLVIGDIVESEKEAIATGKTIASRGDASALYGVAGSLPTKAVVEELARSFLDILYKA